MAVVIRALVAEPQTACLVCLTVLCRRTLKMVPNASRAERAQARPPPPNGRVRLILAGGRPA